MAARQHGSLLLLCRAAGEDLKGDWMGAASRAEQHSRSDALDAMPRTHCIESGSDQLGSPLPAPGCPFVFTTSFLFLTHTQDVQESSGSRADSWACLPTARRSSGNMRWDEGEQYGL